MSSIELSTANTLVQAALAKGRELELRPLAVVVLDAGGNICVINREDRAGLLRVDIAQAKGVGDRSYGDRRCALHQPR